MSIVVFNSRSSANFNRAAEEPLNGSEWGNQFIIDSSLDNNGNITLLEPNIVGSTTVDTNTWVEISKGILYNPSYSLVPSTNTAVKIMFTYGTPSSYRIGAELGALFLWNKESNTGYRAWLRESTYTPATGPNIVRVEIEEFSNGNAFPAHTTLTSWSGAAGPVDGFILYTSPGIDSTYMILNLELLGNVISGLTNNTLTTNIVPPSNSIIGNWVGLSVKGPGGQTFGGPPFNKVFTIRSFDVGDTGSNASTAISEIIDRGSISIIGYNIKIDSNIYVKYNVHVNISNYIDNNPPPLSRIFYR